MHGLLELWYWHLGRTAASLLTALLALGIVDSGGNWRLGLAGAPIEAAARVPSATRGARGTVRYGIWRRSTTPGEPDRLCTEVQSYAEAERQQRSIAAAARGGGRTGCFYVKKH